eukprot:8226268-Alexandrium_andersonii.AAC.1
MRPLRCSVGCTGGAIVADSPPGWAGFGRAAQQERPGPTTGICGGARRIRSLREATAACHPSCTPAGGCS